MHHHAAVLSDAFGLGPHGGGWGFVFLVILVAVVKWLLSHPPADSKESYGSMGFSTALPKVAPCKAVPVLKSHVISTKCGDPDPSLIGTWTAYAGSGTRGGDPDPFGDERELVFSKAPGVVSWTYGGGGGPYTVGDVALPFAVRTPDGESITFSSGDRAGDLVVNFGYSPPATICYRKNTYAPPSYGDVESV